MPYPAFFGVGANRNSHSQEEYSRAVATFNKSERESLEVYGYKFSRSVVAAVIEIRKRSGAQMGTDDVREVEDAWGNPTSSEQIKQIGAALIKAADEWVEENKSLTKTVPA
jgi:hypothetical protein